MVNQHLLAATAAHPFLSVRATLHRRSSEPATPQNRCTMSLYSTMIVQFIQNYFLFLCMIRLWKYNREGTWGWIVRRVMIPGPPRIKPDQLMSIFTKKWHPLLLLPKETENKTLCKLRPQHGFYIALILSFFLRGNRCLIRASLADLKYRWPAKPLYSSWKTVWRAGAGTGRADPAEWNRKMEYLRIFRFIVMLCGVCSAVARGGPHIRCGFIWIWHICTYSELLI